MTTSQAYYVEEVTFLLSCGLSHDEIAHRLGASPAAIAKSLWRAGRHDLARPFDRLRIASPRLKGTCQDCGAQTSRTYRKRCWDCGQRARAEAMRARWAS